MSRRIAALLTVGIVAMAAISALPATAPWSVEEREMIRSLSISELGPLAPDPSNKYGDDPGAAALGHALFFDTRLSSNGKVACASCHVPALQFQDGTPLGNGVGTTNRRTMPIAGTAHSPWFFWDGRKDSQWSQALGPLESAVEHGGDRTQYAHVIARHYKDSYESVFGALPDLSTAPAAAGPVSDPQRRRAWDAMDAVRRDQISRVFANIGKAIAAYERRIQPGPSRFDRYAGALARGERAPDGILSDDEVAGLRIFIGKGNCVQCHNGALLTDNSFHNIGTPPSSAPLPFDSGRVVGVRQALADEFSCTSRYSDAGPNDCAELRFATTEGAELVRAFRTPSLRGVADRAPYMHAGQLATLAEVVDHYNRAPRAPAGRSEIERLKLSRREMGQLEAFLRTLSGSVVAPR
jgi:cytochrome c peroxidase